MKKRILAVILCIAVASCLVPTGLAADVTKSWRTPELASGEVLVTLDGKVVEAPMNGKLLKDRTYVPIRSVATALGATSVIWKNGTVTIKAPGLNFFASLYQPYVIANGRYLYNPENCCLIDGHFMIPVRVLAAAFGATVEWDPTVPAAKITSGKKPIESASTYYDEEDLYWLAHIISAEARGECLEGQIAVGNVVLNRVACRSYPDTVYGVVFDFSCGIQFTPAYTGSVYNTPTESSWIAAKLVLDGANTVGDSLFFAAIKDCWAARNRPYYCTIGGHDFYL